MESWVDFFLIYERQFKQLSALKNVEYLLKKWRGFVKYVITYYRVWWVTVYHIPKVHTYIQSCLGGSKQHALKMPPFLRGFTLNYAVTWGKLKITTSLVTPPSADNRVCKHSSIIHKYNNPIELQEIFHIHACARIKQLSFPRINNNKKIKQTNILWKLNINNKTLSKIK